MSESIIGLYKNVLVLWDGEPFGLREAIGIILILSAAGVEIGVLCAPDAGVLVW